MKQKPVGQMLRVDFLDVIRTGAFGPIKLNDTKEEVINILGTPNGFSNPDVFDAILYDRFEFSFNDNQLKQIYHGYIQNWQQSWRFNRLFHFKNGNFEVKSWFIYPARDTRLEAFTKKLDIEGIPFTKSFFHDSVKLSVGYVDLHFSSPKIWHKDASEWSSKPLEILKLKLTHFFLWQPS